MWPSALVIQILGIKDTCIRLSQQARLDTAAKICCHTAIPQGSLSGTTTPAAPKLVPFEGNQQRSLKKTAFCRARPRPLACLKSTCAKKGSLFSGYFCEKLSLPSFSVFFPFPFPFPCLPAYLLHQIRHPLSANLTKADFSRSANKLQR